MPAELSAVANNPMFGGPAVLLNIVYVGPFETGRKYIDALLITI